MKTQTTLKLIATIVLLSALSQPAKSTNVKVCVDEIFGLAKGALNLARAIASKNPRAIIDDVKNLIPALDFTKLKDCAGITLQEIEAYVKAYVKADVQACINQEIKLVNDAKQFASDVKHHKIIDIFKEGKDVVEDCRNLINVCENVVPGVTETPTLF